MNIGPTELLIVLFVAGLAVVPLGLGIWVAVDASRQPEGAFEAAGTSKTLWIVLPIVGVVACGIVALVAALVWFSSTRARVLAAAGGSPSGGPPPPGGLPGPPTSPPWSPPS